MPDGRIKWVYKRSSAVEFDGEGYDRVFSSANYQLATGVSIERLSAADPSSTEGLYLVGNESTQQIDGTWRAVSRGDVVPSNRVLRTGGDGRADGRAAVFGAACRHVVQGAMRDGRAQESRGRGRQRRQLFSAWKARRRARPGTIGVG